MLLFLCFLVLFQSTSIKSLQPDKRVNIQSCLSFWNFGMPFQGRHTETFNRRPLHPLKSQHHAFVCTQREYDHNVSQRYTHWQDTRHCTFDSYLTQKKGEKIFTVIQLSNSVKQLKNQVTCTKGLCSASLLEGIRWKH